MLFGEEGNSNHLANEKYYAFNQRSKNATTKINCFGMVKSVVPGLELKDQLYGFCDQVLWEHIKGRVKDIYA